MARHSVPTADELRQLLSYDPETGELTWLADTPRFPAGSVAGSVGTHGYRTVAIGNRGFRAHRLAWCIHYGDWPRDSVDHIDGQRDNNRIANLRDVTTAENLRNREYKPRGASGATGVYRAKGGRWAARLYLKDRAPHFGTFATVEEVAAVIAIARKALGFNDRRG